MGSVFRGKVSLSTIVSTEEENGIVIQLQSFQ